MRVSCILRLAECVVRGHVRRHVHVRIYGRSDGRGIEASLDGEKLVHASIRGTDPVSRRCLHRRIRAEACDAPAPNGSRRIRGALQALSTLAAIYSCDFTNARIRIHKIADNAQASSRTR